MWQAYIVAYPDDFYEFWTLTPKLYLMRMEAHNERVRLDYNREVEIAYKNAIFQRSDKMPDIKDYFISDSKSVNDEPTEEDLQWQMRAALANFSDNLPRKVMNNLAE